MSRVGLGLVGCGARIRAVVHALRKATDEVELVAVQDPSAESVRKTLEAYNPGAKVYKDYRDLVADGRVQWVMIGSWNCFHAEHAIAALKAGKHIFCEKPLATTFEDCLAIRDAWKKAGTLFTVGFTLRYSPHYVRIKELVDSGYVGRILSMEFNETLHFEHGGYIHSDWRRKTSQAGTHLLEKCCHDLDLANWIVGSLAGRVASFGGCDFFRPENRHYTERIGPNPKGCPAFVSWHVDASGKCPPVDPFTTDKDIVDNQVAILEYCNGARATFHTNCMAGIPERRMYLLGTDGAIRADVVAGRIEGRRIGRDAPLEDLSAGVSGSHGGGDAVLGRSLADSMLRGEPPRATLEDGLRSAITAFAVDEAMVQGRLIDVTPYWRQAGITDGAAQEKPSPSTTA